MGTVHARTSARRIEVVNVRTVRRIIVGAVSAAAILATASAPGAQDVVELRIRGRYFSDPATVRITVAVEPNADNRTLRVEADGDRLYRSSEVVLEGENGKKIHTVEFKNLPAGYYTIRAEVLSRAQIRGAAEELVVVGDPGDGQ
jgi:hypothetical protein